MTILTDTLVEDIIDFGLHLIYAVVFLVIGTRLVKWLNPRIKRMKWLDKIDPSAASFLKATINLVLRIAVIVITALILGVPGSSFITLFGTAGVAIGLALQGSLSNLAGGLMLLFFRPFNVGDYIKTEENEGTVTQISAFYTTIRTIDNKRIVLPNGNLTNNTITNYSAEPIRMLDLSFSVAYDSDPAQVRRVLLHVAETNPMVLDDPAPIAPMSQHADSALVFSLRAWVAKDNYKPAEFALLEAVKVAFDEEGIQIPFPQMDIHLDQ